MDFDHLKKQWEDIKIDSDSTALNHKTLSLITSHKYKSQYLKILIPQILFTCVYLFGIVFFIAFYKLFESTIHQYLAALAVILLIFIPSLSLGTFIQYYRAGNLDQSLDETLDQLKKKSQQFIRLQPYILVLKVILFSICVVLIPLIYSEHLSTSTIIVTFLIGTIFILVFTFKLWKFYHLKIQRIEDLARSLS